MDLRVLRQLNVLQIRSAMRQIDFEILVLAVQHVDVFLKLGQPARLERSEARGPPILAV